MTEAMERRLERKTGEQQLQQLLMADYDLAPRVAEALMIEAQECLLGKGPQPGIGQVRVYLAKQGQGAGRSVSEMRLVEVLWTVDAGREDREIKKRHGAVALRQVREQRLMDEALEQGGVATQEDLARVLHTSVRTVKRDFAEMSERGEWLPSRGTLQGMGRGQSHKARIITRWLHGETYDQLHLSTRHAVISIQRYIRMFVRVIDLWERVHTPDQIAFLLQIGLPLVKDYLAVYVANPEPACRERLHDQITRLSQSEAGEKGAL